MSDPTSRVLRGLTPATRERAAIMVNALRELGIPAAITSGRRSLAQQRTLVNRGLSRTLDSAHLRGEAFDLDVLGIDRSAIPMQFWAILGPWAEQQLGLRWGGRWRSIWDPGHFELPGSTRS